MSLPKSFTALPKIWDSKYKLEWRKPPAGLRSSLNGTDHFAGRASARHSTLPSGMRRVKKTGGVTKGSDLGGKANASDAPCKFVSSASVSHLWERNGITRDAVRRYIAHLESKIQHEHADLADMGL